MNIPIHSIRYSIAFLYSSWRGTLKTTTLILYEEISKPFEQASELKAKEERLSELNALLKMDADKDGGERDYSDIADGKDEVADKPVQRVSVLDRLHRMQEKTKDREAAQLSTKRTEQEI